MHEAKSAQRWYEVAEHDPIHIAAAEWFVRLQDSDLTSETSSAWQRWMSADARHASAFARIEAVWGEPWENLEARARAAPRPTRRKVLAIAASLAGCGIVAALILAGKPFTQPGGFHLQTAVGENRLQALSDGSQIMAGGHTRLRISYDSDARRVELLQGEATFTVTKDSSRPFVVQSGQTAVTALGTEFNVKLAGDRTVVAVIEGKVKVTPVARHPAIQWFRKDSARDDAIQLDVGQEITTASSGVQPVRTLPDPSTAIEWQSGQLAFRDEPLRYVLEDVNRYSSKQIVIEEREGAEPIGDLRITGTILGNSVTGWLASLHSAFDIRASEEPDRILLYRTP